MLVSEPSKIGEASGFEAQRPQSQYFYGITSVQYLLVRKELRKVIVQVGSHYIRIHYAEPARTTK